MTKQMPEVQRFETHHSKSERVKRMTILTKAQVAEEKLQANGAEHPCKGMSIDDTTAWIKVHGLVNVLGPRYGAVSIPSGWQGMQV